MAAVFYDVGRLLAYEILAHPRGTGQSNFNTVAATLEGLVALGDHFVKGLAQAQDRFEAARYALDFLAQGGFSKPWLLIFDNIDNPRVLDVWWPRGNVHVLVTSRISNWSLGVSPIEVDAWELPAAIAYLVRETGRADLSVTQLAELAEALGRLPLALSHAAAYLRRRKPVTINDYLDDLDRHMSELPKDAEYRSPVYATFRAALLQAEQETSGATALMSLAAFFAPDVLCRAIAISPIGRQCHRKINARGGAGHGPAVIAWSLGRNLGGSFLSNLSLASVGQTKCRADR